MAQLASRQTQARPAMRDVLPDPGVTQSGQYLVFTLGGESYAIGILSIKEIIEFGQLTSLPMMPEVVRGVINLRGAALPVIDLAVRFGKPPTAASRRTCIVIIEYMQDGVVADAGVIVDLVNEVIDIPRAEIEPAPTMGARIRADFVAGIGKVGGNFVIILDIDKVLALDELKEAVQSAMAAAGDIPSV